MSSFPTANLPQAALVSPPRPWLLIGTLGANDATGYADLLSEPAANLANAEPPFAGLTTNKRCFCNVGDGAGVLLQIAEVTGTTNETCIFSIVEWSPIIAPGNPNLTAGNAKSSTVTQWHPTLIASVTATTGASQTGVANGLMVVADLYCDTFTVGTDRGYTGQIVALQPASADDLAATLKIDCVNGSILEFRKTGGTSSKVWKFIAKTFTAA